MKYLALTMNSIIIKIEIPECDGYVVNTLRHYFLWQEQISGRKLLFHTTVIKIELLAEQGAVFARYMEYVFKVSKLNRPSRRKGSLYSNLNAKKLDFNREFSTNYIWGLFSAEITTVSFSPKISLLRLFLKSPQLSKRAGQGMTCLDLRIINFSKSFKLLTHNF